MNQYDKALDKEEWSKHYNKEQLDLVVSSIEKGNVSVWSEELIKICESNSKCLEIGCGSGISSLWLAKNGRNVTALDYTDSSCELVREASNLLKIDNINVIKGDATQDLPFKEKEFDYIFQAGLLEHFQKEEQVKLLKNWSKYSKYMISMIPNKSSLPYRVGKDIMEKNNTWEYGLEIPKHSFIEEFINAGIKIEREYTIGTDWALKFLPKKHYIRKFFNQLKKDRYELDDFMQGYLLVTIGKC